MMQKYIKAFLIENKVLSIKGLGTFSVEYQNSQMHPILQTFTIPGNYVHFELDTQVDNIDSFVFYISEKESITLESATDKINDFVTEIRMAIESKKDYSLGSIGTFTRNVVGNIEFVAHFDADIDPNGFGLENFEIKNIRPIQTSNSSIETQMESCDNKHSKSKKKKCRCGLFLLMFVILILALIIVAYLVFPSQYQQYKQKIEETIYNWFSIKKENVVVNSLQEKDNVIELDTQEVYPIVVEQNTTANELIDIVDTAQTETIESQNNIDNEIITGYYIVIGSFQNEENAKAFFESNQQYDNICNLGQGRTSQLYLIGVGPYSKQEAQDKINNKEIKGWILKK